MLPFVWINKLQICIFMFRYQWNLQHADYADSDRYFYLNLEMHDHNTRCSKWSSTCKARRNIKQFSVYIDTYIDYIHSFIHSRHLYTASSRDYYSQALPAQSR